MNNSCLRCGGILKDVTPKDVHAIKFWSCESCPCQYTENEQGRLHDRWLMPMTLPLYRVIFEEDPLCCVAAAVKEICSMKKEFHDILIEHISKELENPKQRVSDMHDFKFPNEDKLREFLRLVKEGVEQFNC